MTRHPSLLTLAVALSLPALAAAAPAASPAPPAAKAWVDHLKNLELRNIGPAIMGGRIDDVAVVESRPSTFYVATASGGLLKTINNGITFDSMFDDQVTSSIGDVTLAPSDPSIVWVGTGEPNNRQSSSWGNGVYRSLDAGKTWSHLGLADTHHIGRIVVHPANPDVAYVAALGHLWGPNKERGLFRTRDGGKTWTNTKFIDEDTGFVDVAMDPLSPQTLYAASYQRRRAPYGYNGGGPGSGIWKTTDGGETWKKLTEGLPAEGDVGRIGLAVYRRDPRIVYALVEHAKETGTYRSDDKGETWKKVSDTNPRPSYYSKIHIDPNNDQRVWVLGAPLFFSEDGGKTYKSDMGQKIHGDYHAFWINPADSDHMLVGTDGGIHLTYDRGRSWDYVNTVPLAQFYEVHYDMDRPYKVCGGLQDNGSWCGPSRTLYTQGIGNEDWYRVGGGDGFFVVIDPSDSNILYVESQDGNVSRVDLRTNERRFIRPEPPDGQRHRFNWNSPILISPHDPKTVYYGGSRLFGSKDRGDTWSLVTKDLTGAVERDSLQIFKKTAKDMLSRNDGVVHWGTITTVAESPLKAGVLWIGTDDGNLQVSRDGGANWAALKVAGVPAGTYVSRVEASRLGEGACYVAFDGHRANDYTPYLFRTEDFGRTWRSVSGNLPKGGTLSVVREHPKSADLLFVGTERGLWASPDRGGEWHQIRGKFPTVPVDDIQIHPREDDLIVGTHGRGVWILDDLGPLRGLAKATSSDLHVFDMRPATQYRIYNHKGNTGHKALLAPNPPDGALISYYLKAKPGKDDEVTITVTDAAGAVVRELKKQPKEAGVNRASWDLRHEPPVAPSGEGGGFFGPPRGPLVPPGTYTVKVSLGSHSGTRTVQVEEDPRIKVAEAERKEWYEATRATAKLWGRADAAVKTATSLKKQLTDLQEAQKSRPADEVTSTLKGLLDKLAPLQRRLSRDIPLGFAGAPLAEEPDPLMPRARGAYFVISGMTAPPTGQQREIIANLTRHLDEVTGGLNALVENEVPAFNKLLLDKGVGKIDPGKKIP